MAVDGVRVSISNGGSGGGSGSGSERMPMRTAESLAAMRAIFGGYTAAETGVQQAVAPVVS